MKWTKSYRLGVSTATVLALTVFGCNLVEVSAPTAIEEERINNAAGAALLRGDALGEFYRTFDGLAHTTAVVSDEFTVFASSPSSTTIAQDRRDVPPLPLAFWGVTRRAATIAFSKLERFGPRAHAGEMLALRGQATLRLAANFCPGFPITELDNFTAVAGSPVTTEQAYERALEDFNAAFTFAEDSARVLNFVRVGRAAALLGLGRFTEAASAAQDVPTNYTWNAHYIGGLGTGNSQRNTLALTPSTSIMTTIANREGGNGLDFISANDPRVEVSLYATADSPIGPGEPMYASAKYADDDSPIVVSSGIEARLIEAEAGLAEGDAAWLRILNDLRETQVSPPLPALEDPGILDARLDLLFRERAFWLFATGQRLADMLRLIRLYGRDPETVFPTGAYHQHGLPYGKTTSLPFNPLEAGNPARVAGCTGL